MARLLRMTAMALAAGCVLAAGMPASAQSLEAFEEKMTEATLDNGLTILVYERPTAPVVSFFTHVDVGGAQEVPGITGLAHMFEHMAFKGTTRIGTTDAAKERKAMEKIDATYAAWAAERDNPDGTDEARLAELEKAFKDAQEAADEFVRANEFGEIIDRAGGVGLNAFTSSDETGYLYSLPANKVELFAYLESERFVDPVLREFYKERDVVMEERRMRTESQPIGRMIEQFQMAAFGAHPYKQPVVGYMSDLERFTRADAKAFYKKYYVPSNITVAIVGDVDADKLMPMLKKYFGRIPAGPDPEELRTIEPKQIAERVVEMPDPSQPMYAEGYHRPAAKHADDAVYDAIGDILSTGRTSRLYRRMVRDEKIAAFAGAFNGFPGTKYPHLLLFFAIPTPGNDTDVLQAAIREEIERLKSEPVTDEELQRVKTLARANLIRGLRSNSGIAQQIGTYQNQWGDWRELFRQVDKIQKVTAEDIMRVAKETFVATNRTVGMIVTDGEPAGWRED